jgi:hypothetical protein
MSAPFPTHPAQPLVDAFGRMADRVHLSGENDADAYTRMADAAVVAFAGCDGASICTLDATGPVSHGVAGSLAGRADQIQFQEGEGPCLDSAMRGRWVYLPDMEAAGRWARSCERLVDELAVHSMLCCRLATGGAPAVTLGGIGLYSLSLDGFSATDQLLATLLCSLGGLVVSAARQQANLHGAIASRQVIGEAIGILRAQSKLTSDQAFDMLVSASMRSNVKLRDIARQIASRPIPPS